MGFEENRSKTQARFGLEEMSGAILSREEGEWRYVEEQRMVVVSKRPG